MIIQAAWCEAPTSRLTNWVAGVFGYDEDGKVSTFLTESEFTTGLWRLAQISHAVNLAVAREVEAILQRQKEQQKEQEATNEIP